jgi:hypothetical protein
MMNFGWRLLIMLPPTMMSLYLISPRGGWNRCNVHPSIHHHRHHQHVMQAPPALQHFQSRMPSSALSQHLRSSCLIAQLCWPSRHGPKTRELGERDAVSGCKEEGSSHKVAARQQLDGHLGGRVAAQVQRLDHDAKGALAQRPRLRRATPTCSMSGSALNLFFKLAKGALA